MKAPGGGPLEGRQALVTGGGTGLGRAAAAALAAHGARVWLVGRRADLLRDAAAGLVGAGAQASWLSADVTDERDIERITAEVGQLDILVNNAGASDRRDWRTVSGDDWDRVLSLNIRAAFRLSQAFAPGMTDRRWGRIINIGSVYASLAPDRRLYPDVVSFDLPAYGASKAGLLGLTRHLAVLLGPYGITVNAISPGMFETERTSGLIGDRTREALVGRTPMGRLGVPSDLEAAVAFLGSPGAAFVTGQNLVVDGGFSLL